MVQREVINSASVLERLNRKKNAQVTVKRTFNKIEAAVNAVRSHVETGRLRRSEKQVCIMAQDERKLMDYAGKIVCNRMYTLDLETSGLDPYTDFVVGVCLYTPNPEEIRLYIPLHHTDLENNLIEGQMSQERFIDIMGGIIVDKGMRYNNHVTKFDGKFLLAQMGLRVGFYYWDTHIGGKLLNENERSHELKPLYAKYIERRKDWLEAETFGKLFGKEIPFNYMPIDIATVYGADDAYKAHKLMEFQQQYLREDNPRQDMAKIAKLMNDVEMPLISGVVEMELAGVCIDDGYAGILSSEFHAREQELLVELNAYVDRYVDRFAEHEELSRLAKSGDGFQLNFNSPPQLAFFLYDILGCPEGIKEKRKDSDRGTGEYVLMQLGMRMKVHAKFFDTLLKYRGVKKLLTTYVDKLPAVVNPVTHRLHGLFNQYGTDTGRFSSSEPNLQNIPSHEKRIRKMFLPSNGYLFISSDYSQIEPRTLAYMANETHMIEEYRRGRDLYSAMASNIFNMAYEDCGDGTDERTRIKAILLGIMYEKDAKTIAKEFGKPAQWGIDLVENFLNRYPKIRLFKMETIHMAETLGYVTTVEGRKRRLPDMRLDREDSRYFQAFRKCVNARIQGTSADITKRAMGYVARDEELKEYGLRMLMTVHDEIISEVRERYVKEAALRKRELMIKAAQDVLIGMPMKCDVEITDRWYGEKLNGRYGL
jgi:DNA polymerase I-like protein with 3'-5' exonuclease and polymerase domains